MSIIKDKGDEFIKTNVNDSFIWQCKIKKYFSNKQHSGGHCVNRIQKKSPIERKR